MHDRVLESLNEGLPADVVRRRAAVLQVLKSEQSEGWAGEYYEGDGLGDNVVLAIAPDAGIAATRSGCMGLYGSNEGVVDDLGAGRLAFQFNRPNGNDLGIPIGAFSSNVTMVRWGARRYLLEDDEMIQFVKMPCIKVGSPEKTSMASSCWHGIMRHCRRPGYRTCRQNSSPTCARHHWMFV